MDKRDDNLESVNQDIADFQGVDINFEKEYHSIRKIMGTKGTDLELLSYNTTLMYVNAPDKWVDPYFALVKEIDQRKMLIETAEIFKEIGLK